MHAQLTEPDLGEIVETTLSTVLGFTPGDRAERDSLSQRVVGAAVQFGGEWEGALVVGCDDHFARMCAAAMFATDPDAITEADTSDALGELANMLAGNVKPLLPGAEMLSLPMIVQGAQLHLATPGAEVWLGVFYSTSHGPLAVRLFRKTDDAAKEPR